MKTLSKQFSFWETFDIFYDLSKVEFKLILYSRHFAENDKIMLQIFHFDHTVRGYYIVWVSQ